MRLKKTEEKILQFLIENPERMDSFLAVAKRLNISYALFYNSVQELIKKEILTISSVGSGLLWKPKRMRCVECQ